MCISLILIYPHIGAGGKLTVPEDLFLRQVTLWYVHGANLSESLVKTILVQFCIV